MLTSAVLIVVAVDLFPIEVFTDVASVCEFTGSRQVFREWVSGHHTRQWYELSALEHFIDNEHPDLLVHDRTSFRVDRKISLGFHCVAAMDGQDL